MEYRISIKAGRCANGFERDGGHIAHAVPDGNAYGYEKALCGTQPGRKSVGWGTAEPTEITCKECAEKLRRKRCG